MARRKEADWVTGSQAKKTWTASLICMYTFIVYAGSSIYVSSELLIMQRFGVGEFKASMGLALYVLRYGIGPLLFTPLPEGKPWHDNAITVYSQHL
jgi:DHA1 family multidrug resistance protein-like MFS transporter